MSARLDKLGSLLPTMDRMSKCRGRRDAQKRPGQGHDCMDARGRATPGAVAEDEGRAFAPLGPHPGPLPQGEGKKRRALLGDGLLRGAP